jgi:hypothetical protein
MEEKSYTSTHTLGHTGPVTGLLYLYLVVVVVVVVDSMVIVVVFVVYGMVVYECRG